MLLRGSGEKNGVRYEIRATTTDDVDSGVDHGEVLVAFSNALMTADPARLEAARAAVRQAVGDAGFVETAATAANFNQMDRIADSTGIPIDAPVRNQMGPLWEELGVLRFHSAQNTLSRL